MRLLSGPDAVVTNQTAGGHLFFGTSGFYNARLWGTAGHIGHFSLGPISVLPEAQLHISREGAGDVWQQFTNTSAIYNGTNWLTVGTRFGIRSNGDAAIIQTLNQPLEFHTNNALRSILLGNGRMGLNTSAPGNRLEINADAGDSPSGLRFTDLTSGSTPTANPSPNVLSVNSLGDVILVPDAIGGAGGISNVCTTPLTVGTIPRYAVNTGNQLGCSQIIDNGTNVVIGNPGSVQPGARLTAGITSTGTTFNHAMVGELTVPSTAGQHNWSIHGKISLSAVPVNSITMVGVRGEPTVAASSGSSTLLTDVIGTSGYTTVNGSCNNAYGSYGRVLGSGSVALAYGVYGEALAASGTNRAYGVYGKANSTGLNNWAGYFAGNLWYTGALTSTSDLKLKKNIRPLSDALSLLMKLAPRTYDFRVDEFPSIGLSNEHQFGLIAQDVEKVLPQLVSTGHTPATLDEDGKVTQEAVDYKGINYISLLPILIAGVQEQQAIIDTQKERIEALESDMTEMKALLAANIGIVASNMPKARLEQNAPNPFSENTTIRFYVPPTAKTAAIEVNAADGKAWKSFNALTGNGQLVIGAGSMSAGTYTYSLVVDGERIDTRTMVITR